MIKYFRIIFKAVLGLGAEESFHDIDNPEMALLVMSILICFVFLSIVLGLLMLTSLTIN
jgi:hypothetical protein